jgi:hypothetical protein
MVQAKPPNSSLCEGRYAGALASGRVAHPTGSLVEKLARGLTAFDGVGVRRYQVAS